MESYKIDSLDRYANQKVEQKLHSKPYRPILVTIVFAGLLALLKLYWAAAVAGVVSVLGAVTLKDEILLRVYKDDIVVTQGESFLAIPKQEILRWRINTLISSEVLVMQLRDEELPLVKVAFVLGSPVRQVMQKVLPDLEYEESLG